jgi:sugar/nucleoside kinase (ribokinase family)
MLSPSQLRQPIVVAGHACLDITPAFPPGAKVPAPGQLTAVQAAAISTGGAVSNVGVALHKLGAPVRMVGLVGDDFFGRGLREQLCSTGAEVRLQVRNKFPTSYSVVLSPHGADRCFVHCPGVNDEFDPDSDITEDDLTGASALHFGYPPLMRRTFVDGGQSLACLFQRARSARLMTSLDMSFPDPAAVTQIDWPTWLSRALPQVDIFGPSVEELRALLKLPPRDDIHDVPDLAARMLDSGAATICIKLGSRGIYLRTRSEEIWQPSLPAHFVNANGAGDCTIAGLLLALICQYPLTQAARIACCVGAFCVESVTATGGIVPWEQMLGRLSVDAENH